MALKIQWTEDARADIRALDRSTAMWIFEVLHRYALTGAGDVKSLKGRYEGLSRLRLGDYRLIFDVDGSLLRILYVRHRSRAYR